MTQSSVIYKHEAAQLHVMEADTIQRNISKEKSTESVDSHVCFETPARPFDHIIVLEFISGLYCTYH